MMVMEVRGEVKGFLKIWIRIMMRKEGEVEKLPEDEWVII